MSNNILREIEPSLIKKGNVSYTTLDICIKENKIFGILFISGIIPTINDIIEFFNNLLNSVNQNDDIFKLIICFCEKEDYNLSLSKFSNFSCFIIPFESLEKQKLIDKYNIITLPCLIILDKDGKNLQFLKYSEIKNLNSNKIKGWKSTFSLINSQSNLRKYVIGDEGFVFGHPHILVYVDYLGKSPSYGKGNWYCDICGKTNKYDVTNFYCEICGYDVCDSCYEKNKKY